MNKLFIIFIFKFILGLLLIPIVGAVVPTGCGFYANHYECNLTSQTSSFSFNSGVYGIEITGMSLVGSGGTPGSDMNIEFISSDKIIINKPITIIGGAGNTQVCDTSYLRGTDGGDSMLTLNAPNVIINSSITISGGISASSTGSCIDSGGEGGEALLKIIANSSLNIDKSSIYVNSGYTGAGGGVANDAEIDLSDSNNILINNSAITLAGGDKYIGSDAAGADITLNIQPTSQGRIYDTSFILSPGLGCGSGDINFWLENLNLTGNTYTLYGMLGAGSSCRATEFDNSIDSVKAVNTLFRFNGGKGGDGSYGSDMYNSLNNVYFKNSTFLSSAGLAGDSGGTAGFQRLRLYNNNTFEDTIINLSVTGTAKFNISDYSNSFYNKTKLNFIGTGSTVSYSHYEDEPYKTVKTEFRDSIFTCTSASSACNIVFNSTEINFYNNFTIDLNSASNSLKMYADRALFWNFTVESSASQNSNFYAESVSNPVLGLRGSNSFGIWSWNQVTINKSFDEYFLKPKVISLIKKSSDVGSILYNYTNFTCSYNVERSMENESGMYVNISLMKNGVETYSQNSVAYNSNTDYNSTVQVNGSNTNIGENWACRYRFYNSVFSQTNLTINKTISYAYPYNLKIYIGSDLIGENSGVLNTSENKVFDNGYINKYLQNICNTTTCTVPITFTSEISTKLNLSNLNITYGVDSPIDNTTIEISVPFKIYSDTSGIVNLTNFNFNYFDKNANATIVANGVNYCSATDTINLEIIYSNFSIGIIPKGITQWNIYPPTPTSKNVPPFGNKYGDGNPFWNVTALGPRPMDVYLMYNESLDSCATTWFQGQNITKINYTLSNTTPKLVFTNYTYGQKINVSTWTNLSCSWEQEVVLPFFRFIGICSDCVRTTIEPIWYNNNIDVE